MLAIIRMFDTGLAWLAGGLAALLTLVVMLGIVSRGFGEPLVWTDEVSRFLMIWLAVAGWLITSRRRGHIRIRFFHDLLPTRLWWLSETLMQTALIVCGVLLAVFGVELVRRNLDIEATTVPVAMAWIYAPIVLAGVVMMLQGAVEAWEALAASLRTRRAGPADGERP